MEDFLVALSSKGGGANTGNGTCNECDNSNGPLDAMTVDVLHGGWSSAPFIMCGETCTWTITGSPGNWTLSLDTMTGNVVTYHSGDAWDGVTGSCLFTYVSDNGMCEWAPSYTFTV